MRPRDRDALGKELRTLAANGAVTFAGEVHDDVLQLSEFIGTRTHLLRELKVPPGTGLGGRVVASRMPAAVSDYSRSTRITHHYDRPVVAEGLRAILAVPVVVQAKTRAVLYVASRENIKFDDLITRGALGAARRIGTEIAIRDEVDRRLRMLRTLEPSEPVNATVEQLRDIHAELRSLAHLVADPTVRSHLHRLSEHLASLRQDRKVGGSEVHLSPREIDVLAHVARGCTNKETARRLSLSTETVKSYLRSAMSKLDSRSRYEAVIAARKLMLLP
ncbi:LuxR C-terminal-related transcriptional regulator [Rhodococcus sp. NPDC003322]